MAASPASAAPDDVGRWTLGASPEGGRQLTWVAPGKVPAGDAKIQFFDGDSPLGTATEGRDRRTFTLRVPDGTGDLTDPQVRAGGRRLDAAPGAQQRRATAAVAAPAKLPALSFDPGKAGSYATASGDYTLPSVALPGYPAKIEMVGHVVSPKTAPGARPLVLFLHGRHSVCYVDATTEGEFTWPCPAGSKPIPSQLGYLKAQQLLASQGYDTVSIAANGINAQDNETLDLGGQARSSLVRLHLAKWADWAGPYRSAAPAIVRNTSLADLSKVLLVGHSRGGEGVNRAAIDSLVPPPAAQDGYKGKVRWKIAGTFQLGPTLFGHNPSADVPSIVVLPGCDGDVSDLQGQVTVDGTAGVGRGAALHSSVFVVGADHNFFNSEWTPGLSKAPSFDDWYDPGDPVCGDSAPTRLKPVQQQQVGATYVAAAAQLFLRGDQRVLPLLDGSGYRAPSADPASVLTHALGARRTTLAQPTVTGVSVTSTGGTDARVCLEASSGADPSLDCLGQDGFISSPHFVRFWDAQQEPQRKAVRLDWTDSSSGGYQPGEARIKLPKAVSVKGDTALALRLAVPVNSRNTFAVSLVDAAGHKASLGTAKVNGLPGSPSTNGLWAQEVRLPLPAQGVDLSKVTELRLTPNGGGQQAFLIDASGWAAGTRAVTALPVTRADLGAARTVKETDADQVVKVPVTLAGNTKGGRLRVFVNDFSTFLTKVSVVTVKPGATKVDVPVTVRGDDVWDGGNTTYEVLIQAVSGTEVGSWNGYLEVQDDEVAPTVTLVPVADHVTEGQPLTWKVVLSEPLSSTYFPYVTFATPTSGTELSTYDVPVEWLDSTFTTRDPERPLSEAYPYVDLPIDPGQTEALLSIPTSADDQAEGEEILHLQIQPFSGDLTPDTDVTGTVTDAG